jgi:hypothetical protein
VREEQSYKSHGEVFSPLPFPHAPPHLKPPPTLHLQHLPHNLRRLLIRSQQLLTLLPLLLDAIILIEQLPKQILPIQLAHQPILHFIPAVVYQEVHDGLGDLIGDGLAHDVEIRRDEAADEFGFEGFALGQGRFGGLFGLLIWRDGISKRVKTTLLGVGLAGTYKERVAVFGIGRVFIHAI